MAEENLVFLPGASGNVQFWKPVSAKLRHPGARRFVAWPGFGGVPAEPDVNGIEDLVARVVRDITAPVALLAQSMGGVIAVRAALEKPRLVRHLVLSVTSGGIDVASLGAEDWRPRLRESSRALPSCLPTSAATTPNSFGRSRSPCSSCGETRIRSAPWRSGNGSRSCSRTPSSWSSRAAHTTSRWIGPTRWRRTSTGTLPGVHSDERGGRPCFSESW
jgi:pimeloyl-ACP methyl ester carboxylesterase